VTDVPTHPKKAMIWFEGHLGAGDVKLSFNLAEGLARNGYAVYLVSSSVERWKHIFKPNDKVHVIGLPPLERGQDQLYRTPTGSIFPKDQEYVKARSDAVVNAFNTIDPDVVVTQGWPIGREHYDGEMLALMDAVHSRPVKPVLACYPFDANFRGKEASETGVEKGRQFKFSDKLQDVYDCLLIPGNHMLDFTESLPVLKPIKDRIKYAGYFVDSFDARPQGAQEEVVVCSGGGWHNNDLPFYLAAIKSRKHTELKDNVWRLKVSRLLCSDAMYDKVVEAARTEDPTGTKIIVEPGDNKFQQQMVNAKMLIIRSGYNVLTEAVHAGKHILSIPRPYKGADKEQQARAEALQKLGYVRMITHAELEDIVQNGNYEHMALTINTALHDPIESLPPLDTRGADNAAQLFDAMIKERYSGRPSSAVSDASAAAVVETDRQRGTP